MTDVVIDRFSTRAQVRDEEDAARVGRLVSDLSTRELGGALAEASVPDGLWCVRRLDVDVVLDDRTERDLGRLWAHLIVDALLGQLAAAVPARTPDVVRYARHEHALLDLVTSVVRRSTDRAWAWRALAVLAPDDPDPEVDGRGAVLAVLGRHPTAVVPVLTGAVAAAGVAPLHALLGAPGWRTLATQVAYRAGVGALLAPTGSVHRGRSPDHTEEHTPDQAAQLLARPALERSVLAGAWRAGPVAVDRGLADSIALLALVEVEPMLLRRHDAASLLEAVANALVTTSGPVRSGLVVRRPAADPVPASEPDRGSSSDAQDEAGSRPAPTAEQRGRTARPDEADAERSASPPTNVEQSPPLAATVLGGLVHLLATAGAAGIPDDLVDEPLLSGLLPSALLHALLIEMADGPDPADPMLAALSGYPAESPPPPLPADARTVLARYADVWRRTTAERLEPTGPAAADGSPDDRDVVAGLVRRRGHVQVERGWVEVHLRLADVDLGVRRAGLDLDPGFVPWLGAVVVIRYA